MTNWQLKEGYSSQKAVILSFFGSFAARTFHNHLKCRCELHFDALIFSHGKYRSAALENECYRFQAPNSEQRGPLKGQTLPHVIIMMITTKYKVYRALYGRRRAQEDPPIGRILQRY